MAEKKRKKVAGALRTEVFAMRLDPKLRYLAEIAARKQRRSVANFMEWAIEEALKKVPLTEAALGGTEPTVAKMANKLWELEEPDRLRVLATTYPELLSYEEQYIWRVICEHSTFKVASNRYVRFVDEDVYDVKLIRACWSEVKAYALDGEKLKELNEAIWRNDVIPF